MGLESGILAGRRRLALEVLANQWITRLAGQELCLACPVEFGWSTGRHRVLNQSSRRLSEGPDDWIARQCPGNTSRGSERRWRTMGVF